MKSKLRKLNELQTIVKTAKKCGKKVVFANGVFDILHVGHVRYLREARTFGDILIVAVNSDLSTKLIKGESRPFTSEGERIEILNELRCVDFIIIFDDKDVKRLLLELKPDIQVKGTDYTIDTVPEREIVIGYGGSVMIAGDEKTHSSTQIIEMIRN